MPMSTPWGASQGVLKIRRGVLDTYTAGHGGVGVSRRLAEKSFPKEFIENCHFLHGYYWFEEDCDWALPFFFNNEWFVDFLRANKKTESTSFDAPDVQELYENHVVGTMKRWHPETFAKYSGGK